MNLVHRYPYINALITGSSVRINQLPDRRPYMMTGPNNRKIEIGDCFTVHSTSECSGKFPCAATCTTNRVSIVIEVPREGNTPELIATCKYDLSMADGRPLFPDLPKNLS